MWRVCVCVRVLQGSRQLLDIHEQISLEYEFAFFILLTVVVGIVLEG